MKKFKRNKGILFWITGLSGSGKTSIAEKIKNKIIKKYGPTLTLSGDDLRTIFNYKKFSRKSRIQYALSYSKFCKYITNQNVNVISKRMKNSSRQGLSGLKVNFNNSLAAKEAECSWLKSISL